MLKIVFLVFLFAVLACADVVYLNILHTNDIHGRIVPHKKSFMNSDSSFEVGGGAWIAAYVNQVRDMCMENGEYCLLIDAGDVWHGTPLGNYNSGEFVIKWMNSVGYDMMTLGNHDFDHGAENAIQKSEMADFPVICANFTTSNGEIPPQVLPYIFLNAGGVKIAFVGVTTSDVHGLVDSALLEGYLITPEVEAVTEALDEVYAQGAEAVILVSHLGQPVEPERFTAKIIDARESGENYTKDHAFNSAELTTMVEGIDLVVSGHTHVALNKPWVNSFTGTIVVQGHAYGAGVGHIRLALDEETGSILGYDLPGGDEYIILQHDRFMADVEQCDLIDDFREIAESGMDEVIGEAEAEITRGTGEHPLGRLVSDAVREATHADVGLVNRGGIRNEIPCGPVTAGLLYTVVPFEEDLFTFRLTGSELLKILETGMLGQRRDMEISGFSCRRNQAAEDGSKIENPLVDGKPLDPEAIYTLATTGYLARGNLGYEIMLEHNGVFAGITLFQAVRDHIADISPIEPDWNTRIVWIYRK